MKRSYVISIVLAIIAVAWIASGQFGSASRAPAQKAPADLSTTSSVPTVRVRQQSAEPRRTAILLRGYTEALRDVEIKAEVRGRIVELPVEKGTNVAEGTVIAKIAEEDRPAKLKKAKALLEQRRIEFKAASKLAKKGFRAETTLVEVRATVDAAEADVRRAEIELENLTIRTPFDGVLDDRTMEIGDFVDIGDSIAHISDLDPILAIGNAAQRDVGRLSIGAPGFVRLVDGTEVEGRIRFIDSVADPETRTFRIELEVENPGSKIQDGLIAELYLPTETTEAHRVSPAILTLTDSGSVGVKALGPDNRIVFHPVRIIDEDRDGIWLTGLPETVTLVTVGQEFVTEGQLVEAVDESTLEPLQQGSLP